MTSTSNKPKHGAKSSGSNKKRFKPKMTKEERRAKYTKIARDRKDKERLRARDSRLTCFLCRQKGHSVQNCPQRHAETANKTCATAICFKCGSTEHSLASCPLYKKAKDKADLPYASCFLCQQTGHLARDCPTNSKGIYINGGSCRLCGSTSHRATDCPENNKAKKEKAEQLVCGRAGRRDFTGTTGSFFQKA